MGLAYYWSPLEMYLFLRNDFFVQLSLLQQLVSVFIAISIGAFILILLKNCNFISTVLYHTDDVKEKCVDEQDDAQYQVLRNLEISKNNEENEENQPKRRRKRRRRKKKRVD